MISSLFIVLVGIPNTSVLFYPCYKNIRHPLYATLVLLFIVTSLRGDEARILVMKPIDDPIYKIAELVFFGVLVPNTIVIALLLTCFFIIAIIICVLDVL